MDPVTALGLLAATLTTASFVPQVIKTWRTKSAEDLSVGTFSMLCLGVFCWLVYGLLIEDLPVIVANAVTLILVGFVLVQAILYRQRGPEAVPEEESLTESA